MYELAKYTSKSLQGVFDGPIDDESNTTQDLFAEFLPSVIFCCAPPTPPKECLILALPSLCVKLPGLCQVERDNYVCVKERFGEGGGAFEGDVSPLLIPPPLMSVCQ